MIIDSEFPTASGLSPTRREEHEADIIITICLARRLAQGHAETTLYGYMVRTWH